MKLLPYEKITFKSRLKKNQVIDRLTQFTDQSSKTLFSAHGKASSKPYCGTISENSFVIRRIIQYRNSFLPKISGEIQDDFDSTTISVTFRLHTFVLIFMIIWFLLFFIGTTVVVASAASKNTWDPIMLMTPGILLVFYVILLLVFKFESNKSKKDLKQLLEAEVLPG